MTAQQWECLLAASHGTAEKFHGKTKMSLYRKGLLVYVRGLEPTLKGRNLLHERYAAGRIGPRGAGGGA